MKVLLVTDWNPLQGGAEAYILQLREALQEAGDEVRLLTASTSEEARRAADYLAPASDHVLAKSLLQIANPFAASTARKAVKDFQPDIVLVNMFALFLSPSPLLALGDTPYVLLISDYKVICPMGHRLLPDLSICHHPAGRSCLQNSCQSLPHWLRDQVRYQRIGTIIRKASAVISTSDSLRESLEAQSIESESVPLFSDLPEPFLQRVPADHPLFLYVGRLDVEKGVDTLLRAFALCHAVYPESRLRIIGRGALQESLEQLAISLGVESGVTFCGWQEPPAVNQELSRAWAMVAPSRWPEPFGLVALEAMFRGVPAVVPAHGGFAETVEHGVSGLLFPPDDADALSEQLQDLASSRSFPTHSIDSESVSKVQERYAPAAHVALIRKILIRAVSR